MGPGGGRIEKRSYSLLALRETNWKVLEEVCWSNVKHLYESGTFRWEGWKGRSHTHTQFILFGFQWLLGEYSDQTGFWPSYFSREVSFKCSKPRIVLRFCIPIHSPNATNCSWKDNIQQIPSTLWSQLQTTGKDPGVWDNQKAWKWWYTSEHFLYSPQQSKFTVQLFHYFITVMGFAPAVGLELGIELNLSICLNGNHLLWWWRNDLFFVVS